MSAPRYFASPRELRAWFDLQGATHDELVVGFWKVGTGKPSVTWAEAVDEALCVGWIDGIRRRVDDEAYTVRFTPRRPRSMWSAVNIRNVERLEREGRMTEAGRKAFAARRADAMNGYSFEQEHVSFSDEQLRRFQADEAAWAFWIKQPPSYQRPATWLVVSAKKEETRAKRLANLITHSARGERIPQLVSPGKKPRANERAK